MYASRKRQAVAIRQSWCDTSGSGPCPEPRGLRGGVWSTPVPSPTVTPVSIADSAAFLIVPMPFAHGGSVCRPQLAAPSPAVAAQNAHTVFELAFADPRGAATRQQWLLL